jgi:hypothetical protein
MSISLEPAAPRPLAKGRPTVGILTAWADDLYENEILTGILAAAYDHDVNLIRFVGEVLKSGYPKYEYSEGRNSIFELVNATSRLDGLLLFSVEFSVTKAFAEIVRLCARYRPRPLISLGMELPGGEPRLLVDNASGLR